MSRSKKAEKNGPKSPKSDSNTRCQLDWEDIEHHVSKFYSKKPFVRPRILPHFETSLFVAMAYQQSFVYSEDVSELAAVVVRR
ncbi:hypothetical protein RSAG8_07919, partial [Rhizoctonia solani AG-8 WAC10335]